LNLLFVSGEYPPDIGGVGDYTALLRSALGVSSSVLTRREVKRWDARALLWLVRHAPREGIVHIQYQPAAFDLLADVCLMPLWLRLVRPRVRVMTTFHDARVPYAFPGAGRLRFAFVRLMARWSHVVIAADERDLAAVGGHGVQVPIGSNVACAPVPDYDRAAFREALGVPEGAPVVVYFGLLNASKGLDLLLDAFARVQEVRPSARLLVLGGSVGASDVTDRQTAARLRTRFDAAHAVRPGWLEAEALSAHLLAADVALLPYVDGASPRRGSLLACAAHGLPIVSTEPASAAVADAVQATSAEPETLARAVLHVLDNQALRVRLQASAAALTKRTSWSRIAEQHRAMYSSLAHAPSLHSAR
jgi:glycosyltransferase involved in cell wall biosynthesis